VSSRFEQPPNIAIQLSRFRKGVFFADHTLRPGDGQRSKDLFFQSCLDMSLGALDAHVQPCSEPIQCKPGGGTSWCAGRDHKLEREI
jgi:hypothetical protein